MDIFETFKSSHIRLLANKCSIHTIVHIIIDDCLTKTIDLYSDKALYNQEIFSINDLSDSEHTLKVIIGNVGTHNLDYLKIEV